MCTNRQYINEHILLEKLFLIRNIIILCLGSIEHRFIFLKYNTIMKYEKNYSEISKIS